MQSLILGYFPLAYKAVTCHNFRAETIRPATWSEPDSGPEQRESEIFPMPESNSTRNSINPDATVKDALAFWIPDHARYVKPKTLKCHHEMQKPLTRFFGHLKLSDITITDVREYQDARRKGDPQTGARKPISAGKINQEIILLGQVMKEARLWNPISELLRPLPLNREGSGVSMTAEQEAKFLEVAFSKRKWRLTAHCVRIMFKTGLGFGELAAVRRQDVDLDKAIVHISNQGAKNKYRVREVPLLPEALESMSWIIDRWQMIGGSSPDQLLLPALNTPYGGHRNHKDESNYDFYKPQMQPKKHWHEMKAEAREIPELKDVLTKSKSNPFGFRLYDCRVTAITRTLSDGKTPLHAAMRVFGHVSQEMQKRYYKPDNDTLREALSPLHSSPTAGKVYATAQKVDQALDVKNLIKKLQKAGIPADKILAILADEGEA